MPKIPAKTRRLSREEAKRLGVSFSAKRRVDAKLKRVTKSTKLYTDRAVTQAKLGTTREKAAKKYTLFRKTTHGDRREYQNLTRANFIKLMKKTPPHMGATLYARGYKSGGGANSNSDASTGKKWSATSPSDVGEMNTADKLDRFLKQFHISEADRFVVILGEI